MSLVVGIRFLIFGFMNSIDRSTHFIASWEAYTAGIPMLKRRTFLYPLQHCVAHASLNFYTYIVYSTLKHVRNLLSIFFFLEESRTLSLAFPILSCHTDMNITHFFRHQSANMFCNQSLNCSEHTVKCKICFQCISAL